MVLVKTRSYHRVSILRICTPTTATSSSSHRHLPVAVLILLLLLLLLVLSFTWLRNDYSLIGSNMELIEMALQMGSGETVDNVDDEADETETMMVLPLQDNPHTEEEEKTAITSNSLPHNGQQSHADGSLSVLGDTSKAELQQPSDAICHEAVAAISTTMSWNDERAAALDYVKSFQRIGRSLKFFHIPKTAGTAIEYAAGKNHLSWGSCLFNHKPKRDICRYPPGAAEWPQYVGWWHLPTSLFPLADNDPYKDAELFGVIRDPHDRMVSEFHYICTLKVFDWRPNQCDRSKLLDATYMNEWITRKIRKRKRDSGFSYLVDNGHFTPQYDFIVGPHQVRMLDYVLKMNDESLADDFSKLVRAFGLSSTVQLQKLNALGAAARGDAHLTVEHLDDASRRVIQELYPFDFAIGNYQVSSTES